MCSRERSLFTNSWLWLGCLWRGLEAWKESKQLLVMISHGLRRALVYKSRRPRPCVAAGNFLETQRVAKVLNNANATGDMWGALLIF